MLSERSINRIGKHLENEGWTDDEIAEAIESLETSKKVINIALPMHFKEEAIQHARCHCKYVLNLKESSKGYDKAFEDAYSTYLIEAYENSRGIEGPTGGSHKKANPAGIEVFAFDKISTDFIPENEKKDVSEKAPIGLLFMGKDEWLQKSFQEMTKYIKDPSGKVDKEIVKEIATQYSAAVVSLSNSFLYAFGKYKTKRKFGGKTVYKEGDDSKNTLEFSKKTGSDQDKEKMLEVAYRQIARQIYIISMSTIIAGSTALDEKVVVAIEKGIKERLKYLWSQRVEKLGLKDKKAEMNLAFVLNRKTREAVVESFYNRIKKDITEYKDKQEKIPGVRQSFLEEVQQSIIRWASISGKNK